MKLHLALITLVAASLTACLAESTGREIGDLGDHEHEVAVAKSTGNGKGDTPACGGHKIAICHVPPGNPRAAHTICIDESGWNGHHLHRGDSLGACPPVCADRGDRCARDSDCCVGSCSQGKCQSACVPEAGACGGDEACCTGYCSGGACRAECSDYFESCSTSTDCCFGATCSGGACIPTI
ncbi:MAG: hypothetical protein HS111_04925 [Kofleriaceae bacterium]|nr:hypothetical protein [Kofleriaceae bacterium]MCL4225783.1 hypothetical protein [Myxococcales bacterium]